MVMAVSLLMLLSWLGGSPSYQNNNFYVGWWSMNPLTAICFALSSSSLFLFQLHRSRSLQYAALGFALVVMTFSVLRLANLPIYQDLTLDRLLFTEKIAGNRMSPITAVNFALISLTFLLINVETKHGQRPSQYAAIFTISISLFALIGYLYGVEPFYKAFSYIPMALHTAICFFILCLGILFRDQDRGFMKLLASPGLGGMMVRRLLPAALFITPLLGWLRILGERAGYYDTEFGVALSVMLNLMIFSALIFLSCLSLDKTDHELKKKTQATEDANKELEAFSYSVSHDLRAPLRHMDGFVKLMQKSQDTLDDKSKRYLGIIGDAAGQMGRLIDDLLLFSRMGRTEFRWCKISMQRLVDDVLPEIKSSVQDRAIEWIIPELPEVECDPAMMRQALVNLFSNAVKYSGTKEKAVIEMGHRDQKGEHVFFVKDNGVGFEMQYAHKLFGVFQRLHAAEQFEGTGIGLANVKRIINRHHGQVWAESILGEGATFYFTLPNAKTPPDKNNPRV